MCVLSRVCSPVELCVILLIVTSLNADIALVGHFQLVVRRTDSCLLSWSMFALILCESQLNFTYTDSHICYSVRLSVLIVSVACVQKDCPAVVSSIDCCSFNATIYVLWTDAGWGSTWSVEKFHRIFRKALTWKDASTRVVCTAARALAGVCALYSIQWFLWDHNPAASQPVRAHTEQEGQILEDIVLARQLRAKLEPCWTWKLACGLIVQTSTSLVSRCWCPWKTQEQTGA